MRRLVVTPGFRRAFRKFVRRNRPLQQQLEDTLKHMETDVFAPNLGAHKLSGQLNGLWACSCGYDCRIIFSLEADEETGEEVIVLLNVGTHDEVY